MKGEYEIYRPNDSITFILTDTKTLVKTKYQTFIVLYDHHNYKKQLATLREMIRNNQITRLDELISYCNFRYGSNRRSQMYGLELRQTTLEWHINGYV